MRKTSDYILNNQIKRSGYSWAGNGRLFGYPGLEFTKHKISEYIPKCEIFIEPFAGMGRITELVISKNKIINDKSEFAYNYLKSRFPNYIVENLDFIDFLKKYPNGDCYFFDPPWIKTLYDDKTKSYCNREIREYYDLILKFTNNTNSLVFICSENNRKIGDLDSIVVEGRRKIGGHKAKTRLSSNRPLKRHQQHSLDSFGEKTP